MPRATQRLAAEHMVDAVGYLIVVAAKWELPRVVRRLDQVRSELLSVVANDMGAADQDETSVPGRPKYPLQ
jgi:hypothetical protein